MIKYTCFSGPSVVSSRCNTRTRVSLNAKRYTQPVECRHSAETLFENIMLNDHLPIPSHLFRYNLTWPDLNLRVRWDASCLTIWILIYACTIAHGPCSSDELLNCFNTSQDRLRVRKALRLYHMKDQLESTFLRLFCSGAVQANSCQLTRRRERITESLGGHGTNVAFELAIAFK